MRYVFCTCSSISGHIGCVHILATEDYAAMHTGVLTALQDPDSSSSWEIPRGGVAGWHGDPVYFLEGPPYCFCFAFASAVDCEGPHFNVLTFLPSHSSSPSPLSPLEHSPPSLSGKSYSLHAHCFFILSASSSSWFLFQSVSSLFFFDATFSRPLPSHTCLLCAWLDAKCFTRINLI